MREPINLASASLRSYILAASDEFFGASSALIKDESPTPESAWITRRRRQEGSEFVVLRLGVPGIVQELVIDTTSLTDNYAPAAAVYGCVAPHNARVGELTGWTEILPPSHLGPDRENHFSVKARQRFTHLKLSITPDGGIARFRVLGQPVPNWMSPGHQLTQGLDLAALVNGGHVHLASQMQGRQNLIMPGDALSSCHGWCTPRRTEPGNDWAQIRLVGPGQVVGVTIDTAHYQGCSPAQAQIEASTAQDPGEDDWFELLPAQNLIEHSAHFFQDELIPNEDLLWLRLNILPDGGVARLRVWGQLSESGFSEARLLYLNSSTSKELSELFLQVCHSQRWITEIIRSAPFTDLNDLLKKGASAWSKCSEHDWKEALDGHPRIGEKRKGTGLSAKWSRGEQSKASNQTADAEKLALLRERQEEYFQKFGFIFLICATGQSTADILRSVESRLNNSTAEELQIVAEEQAKIIHLRLEKLLQ